MTHRRLDQAHARIDRADHPALAESAPKGWEMERRVDDAAIRFTV